MTNDQVTNLVRFFETKPRGQIEIAYPRLSIDQNRERKRISRFNSGLVHTGV
jgi:hypothetical protein